MSATAATGYSVSYERQSVAHNNRTCGAACLSMVYGSLGLPVPQDQIWPAIAKPNRFGSLASTTHLMVRDALSRGFDAVAFQARQPLFVLRLCRDAGIRVILNHRLSPESATGHYSVLVDVNADEVLLHDPFFGPQRRLAHGELMALWQPGVPNSEIVGDTLIAVADNQPAEAGCVICGKSIPAKLACPQCRSPVVLRPAAPLGCIDGACLVRMWNYVCCPACDYMWAFDVRPPQAAAESDGAAASDQTPTQEPDTWNFKPLFAALDGFLALVAAHPEAASHPDVQKQVSLINTKREELKQAQTEAIAMEKAQKAKMAAMVQESERRKEAHRQKLAEMNTPGPPLDGAALGQALLKNLGLIE